MCNKATQSAQREIDALLHENFDLPAALTPHANQVNRERAARSVL
jgi:hypothetical protein